MKKFLFLFLNSLVFTQEVCKDGKCDDTKNAALNNKNSDEIKEQVETDTEHAPKGKIDYARLFGYAIMSIIIISVIAGWLDLGDAETLIKKLNIFSFIS